MIAIYARVSTEDQVKHGYSLDDQIRECRKKARTDQIIKYIDEGISGEVLNRPQLTKLINDVKDGLITKVICLDPDRLSRKLNNQLIIAEEIERRAELLFVNGEYAKTPEGILFFQMRGAISEFEKAKITERMSRGRREKALQGKVVRDCQIYGYDYDRQTRQFTINEIEAKIVRLIFELFTGKTNSVNGINGIAHYLTSLGIATKKNCGVWHRQVVRQILANKAYIGDFYHNRWNTEGMLVNKYKDPEDRIPLRERPKDEWILVSCPAIIDEKVFLYVQKLLDESRRRWSGISKNQYLLSGLIRCGECGNTMTGRKSCNWGRDVFEYSDIKNTSGAKFKGCGKRVKTVELDELVWKTVLTSINNPDEIAANNLSAETPSFEEVEISLKNERLEAIRLNRQKLLTILMDNYDLLGITGEQELLGKLRKIKEEEAQLVKQITLLEEQTTSEEQSSLKPNLLQEAAEYYFSKTVEISFEDKQHLIRYVVKEVRIYKDEVKVFGF